MDKREAGADSTQTLFSKLIVLFVFIGLMTGAIFYLNKSAPNLKALAMDSLAEQFEMSVTNAHWQWQAEGRPRMVMLIHYEPRMNDEQELVETDRRPIAMSHLGWPRFEPNGEGCGELWEMVLNLPLEVEGFKVYAEYFDGVANEDNALSSRCRYRMSVGPHFDYYVYTGKVEQEQ